MGLLAVLFSSMAAFFWYAFYIRYWKWHAEIEQVQSSFMTPEGDNLTSGGAFWALPALLFSAVGFILLAVLLVRVLRRHSSDPTRLS